MNNGTINPRELIKKRLYSLLVHQNARAIIVIFLIVLAVYLIPVALGRSQNPILQRAGLSGIDKPGYVTGQSTIDPNDGFTAQALGRRAAMSWLDGDVPYWNHYEGVGMPLAAGMQSAAFFPLTILLRLHNGFIYMHFLLQLIAGYFTYLFLKKIKLKFSLAVLGGVLFALGGSFAWLTNAPFNPIAFLPMLMLGMEYALANAKSKKRGGWILIALALSLSLYAGFPETAYINAVFAYGWGAVRFLQLRKEAKKSFIYKALLGSIVGLLLSAPILVPFLGYLPETHVGGHAGNAYAYLSLPIQTLPSLVLPYIFGPIFAFSDPEKGKPLMLFWSNVGGYLTVPLVLTAVMGLYAKRPTSIKLYLFIFSTIIALKIYGFKPVAFLINMIPGMNQVAFYRYSIPVLSFALIVLAMFGVNSFVKAEISKKKVIILTCVGLLATLVLAYYAKGLYSQLTAYPSRKLWALFSVCWALSVTLAIGISFFKPRLRFIGIVTVLAVDSILMFSIPYFSLPKMSKINYDPINYLKQNIGLDRFYTLGPIAPNYGSYFEVASININDLPIPKKWVDYIPEKLDKNAIPVVFTGYSRSDPEGPTSLEEFGRNIREYENIGVKYLITGRGQVSEHFAKEHSLERVFTDVSFDILKLPSTQPYFEGPADCQLNYNDRNYLTTNCRSEATVTRRELSMPGWTAVVNGQKQPVGTEEEIFQSITVPAGKSSIKFLYMPPYMVLGFVAFGVGLLIIVIHLFGDKAFRKRFITLSFGRPS